eukprot:429375_1
MLSKALLTEPDTDVASGGGRLSSIDLISNKDHEETISHDNWHKRKSQLLVIIVLLSFVLYGVYGYDKYTKSKAHPQTKTILKPMSSYDVPLIYACPVESEYGTIHPYRVLTQNTYMSQAKPTGTFYEDKDPRFKYKCDEWVSTKLSRETWTILPFTQVMLDANTTCYALIPPRNYKFTSLLTWRFVWEPSQKAKHLFLIDQNNSLDVNNFYFILSHQLHFGVEYNIIHPDSIADWYNDLKANKFVYDVMHTVGYTPSDVYAVTPWTATSIGISLYSRQDLSGNEYNSYLTQLTSGNRMSKEYLQYIQYSGYGRASIPQFEIQIIANTMNGVGQGDDFLFHSRTEEYQDYGWMDIWSGLGGAISLALQVFGLVAAVVLTGGICGCIGWKGMAPYQSFGEAFQVRLRRFINKEMKPLNEPLYQL